MCNGINEDDSKAETESGDCDPENKENHSLHWHQGAILDLSLSMIRLVANISCLMEVSTLSSRPGGRDSR